MEEYESQERGWKSWNSCSQKEWARQKNVFHFTIASSPINNFARLVSNLNFILILNAFTCIHRLFIHFIFVWRTAIFFSNFSFSASYFLCVLQEFIWNLFYVANWLCFTYFSAGHFHHTFSFLSLSIFKSCIWCHILEYFMLIIFK